MLTVIKQPVSPTFGPEVQQVREFIVHQHNPEIGGKDEQMKLWKEVVVVMRDLFFLLSRTYKKPFTSKSVSIGF
jgi:hypothetical protein